MHNVVTILVVIALAIIGGPVVGGISLVAALLWMVPGLGQLVASAVFVIAMLVLFGVQSLVILVGTFCVLLVAAFGINYGKILAKDREKEAALLVRRPIIGTDLYEDQHGQRWRKVAGIFKRADQTESSSGV